MPWQCASITFYPALGGNGHRAIKQVFLHRNTGIKVKLQRNYPHLKYKGEIFSSEANRSMVNRDIS